MKPYGEHEVARCMICDGLITSAGLRFHATAQERMQKSRDHREEAIALT
jgi:hypothetical protein